MRKKSIMVICSTLFLIGMVLLFSSSTHAAQLQHNNSALGMYAIRASLCPPNLVLGSNDDNGAYLVRAVQDDLNRLYRNYSDPHWFGNSPKDFKPYTQDHSKPLKVDGKFGDHTFNAVWDYQSWNGLKVDGIVGPQTWASLGEC